MDIKIEILEQKEKQYREIAEKYKQDAIANLGAADGIRQLIDELKKQAEAKNG